MQEKVDWKNWWQINKEFAQFILDPELMQQLISVTDFSTCLAQLVKVTSSSSIGQRLFSGILEVERNKFYSKSLKDEVEKGMHGKITLGLLQVLKATLSERFEDDGKKKVDITREIDVNYMGVSLKLQVSSVAEDLHMSSTNACIYF